MKKILLVLMAMLFILSCGSKEQAAGKTEDKPAESGEKTYTIGDQTISTFEDVIALFKQEIQIRSENDKLEKIFKEKRKELYYFFKKLNIEPLTLKPKEGF